MRPGPYPGAALVAWLRSARRHGGVAVSQLHHALPWLLRYVALEPFRLYESIRYDRHIEAHSLAYDPVFVLGHWRSGTSLLQELVSLDERYATCSLVQCLFPECALTAQGWLPGLIDLIASTLRLRYPIQDRPLRARLPAEEEIAMLCLTDSASSNWGQLFPTTMRQHVADAGTVTDSNDDWLAGYRYVVNKLSIASGGRRLVLKSPMNTARLRVLSTTYPRAVFIHIHRHPFDVFASSRRLWQMIQRQSSLQTISPDEIDELILDVYATLMRRFLDDRASVAPSRLVDVRYEQLRADPAGTLGSLYTQLALGDPPIGVIGRFVRETPAPPSRPRGLDQALTERIRHRWGFAFEAWNYE